MLSSVEQIYNTLFEVIEATQAHDVLERFERGFWYTAEEKGTGPGMGTDAGLDEYPYGCLLQPSWTPMEYESTPVQDRYQIEIELVILTNAPETDGLFFPREPGAQPTRTAAIELLIAIGKEIGDQYTFGLPFNPTPDSWYVERWRFGAGGRPRHPVLQTYLDNPLIAGASVEFLFDVIVDGPLPHNAI